MRILITGHKGFIGSHLFKTFKEMGHDVFGIDKRDKKNPIDIMIPDQLFEEIERVDPDIIYHHAAEVSVPQSIDYPMEHFATNMYGTGCILECMRLLKIKKIVFASSSSVYGDMAQKNVRETWINHANQLSPYALSKKMCEDVIDMYSKLYGIEYLNFRYFNVYGPGCRGVIKKWFNDMFDGKDVLQFGDTVRDYTHVQNVVLANVSALECSTWNKTMNIGCGVGTSLTELSEMMGIETIKKDGLKCDVKVCTADISKAKRVLGYEPIINLRDGLVDIL